MRCLISLLCLALFVASGCEGAEPITCEVEGVSYAVGATWDKSCNSCSCDAEGLVICTTMACAEPLTCETGESVYAEGESWEVDCNTCTCTEGAAVCTEMAGFVTG